VRSFNCAAVAVADEDPAAVLFRKAYISFSPLIGADGTPASPVESN
jgi:hypothetical protein